MKRIRAFVEHFDLVALFLIAGALLVAGLLGADVPLSVSINAVLACLVLIAVHIIREGATRNELRGQISSVVETLGLVHDYLKPRTPRIELADPRSDRALFEGWKGVFYSFNAPWRLEENTDIAAAVAMHARRYADPDFHKTVYLMIDPESSDTPEEELLKIEHYLQFFDALTALAGPEVEAQIEHHLVGSAHISDDIVYFVGTKEGGDRAIVYIGEGIFIKGGMPQLALLIKDSEAIRSLRGDFETMLAYGKQVQVSDLRQLLTAKT